jgi:hypothetical protein
MASLKKLAKVLEVSEGFLKNVTKGTKKGKDDYLTLNTANCCRAIARYTGYSTREKAEKAIRSNVKLLYMASDTYANKISRLSTKYGKEKKELLKEAAQAMKANNFQEYNRIISSNKDLKQTYKRKCMKSINKKLIEQLRSSDKTNRATAKGILMAAGSKEGYKIIVPREKIEKEIQKRLKRYGAVASLFWNSAKQLNPKIKPDKLSKEKRKKHKLTNGMSYKTKISNDAVTAIVNHRAETMNKKFRSRLMKRIHQQEKFWAKQAEKQIVAAEVLNKLISRV